MPDTALDSPVLILALELFGIGAGGRVRRAISVTFESDGRHGNSRTLCQALFELVIFRLAFRQAEPPAIIMDYDTDVVRIVERLRGAVERGIVEVPFWRSRLP